jgi:hypothetical protein
MRQDWKTLALVVVGAAIAGWWMVRALGGRAPSREPAPAEVVSAPAPAAEATASDEDAAPTAAPAQRGEPPTVANEEGEVALILRDLDVLARALVRDQRIEDRVMPRVNDALDVPGVVTYRRAPDFWESALGDPEGGRR